MILLSCCFFINPLSVNESNLLGEALFANECGNREAFLIFWNEKEPFPSLGIGHFIWFPEKSRSHPFEETFPQMIQFLRNQGISIPIWLDESKGAPWENREAFKASQNSREMKELAELLTQTKKEQAAFVADRLHKEMARILDAIEVNRRRHAQKVIQEMKAQQVVFPLFDYLHFKGSGLTLSERYKNRGWGLKQVLENLDPQLPPLEAFIQSAKARLQERVQNSAPEKGETRFLQGWLNRVDQYRNAPF